MARTKPFLTVAYGLLAFALSGAAVVASGSPFSGYCAVEKVIRGQDDASRPTVQIFGTCAMTRPGGFDDRGNYVFSSADEPRHGYLYYVAPKGKETLAANEWADLQALAASAEVVGIGNSAKVCRLRWADEKPQHPDEYSTDMGLSKITKNPAFEKLVASILKAAGK